MKMLELSEADQDPRTHSAVVQFVLKIPKWKGESTMIYQTNSNKYKSL